MSAPDTNIERQKTEHAASLKGIRGAMIFGGVMFLCAVFYAVINGNEDALDPLYSGEVAPVESSVGFDTYAPGTNQSN